MSRIVIKNGILKLQPYSANEIASIYAVNYRTLNKWLLPFEKEIGKKMGRYFTISQIRIIFEKIGLPAELKLDY